jgi:cell division protein FtsB
VSAQDLLTSLGGAIVTALGAALYFRRKLSGDNKAIAEEKGQTNLNDKLTRRIDQLEAQLSDLRDENTTLVKENSRMAEALIYLRERVTTLVQEKHRRTQLLDVDVRRIVDTGFVDLDDNKPTGRK